jgi:pyruvate dehydrogenase E2 component (dihydrolipoamide acetyltransferase)
VVEDAVVPRPVVALTLAADHRASDGATGGRLLREIARLLARPEDLVPGADAGDADPEETATGAGPR